MFLFEDIINEELTCKKDAEEKPKARVQEEAFRRGLPVEGLFVQSTEVSAKESNMIICVLERGVHSHVCAYPDLPHQEGFLYFSDTLMGTAVCPHRLYLPLSNRKATASACSWLAWEGHKPQEISSSSTHS